MKLTTKVNTIDMHARIFITHVTYDITINQENISILNLRYHRLLQRTLLQQMLYNLNYIDILIKIPCVPISWSNLQFISCIKTL